MKIGLFIPCYIDQFFPQVGLATVDVLEAQGVEIEFPEAQTCCGQPLANSGCTADARRVAQKWLDVFQPYTHVVCPSGSCVAMVRHHFEELMTDQHHGGSAGQGAAHRETLERLKHQTYELCEFLTDVLGMKSWPGSFPHRVGLHQSCHGLRELRMGSSSERVEASFNKPRQLLEGLAGIELTELQRVDECCGFGGTFAVGEEAVSCMMGLDRIADHERGGTEVLTSADMSCLMHLGGLIRRQQKPIHVMHIAEILAGREVPA